MSAFKADKLGIFGVADRIADFLGGIKLLVRKRFERRNAGSSFVCPSIRNKFKMIGYPVSDEQVFYPHDPENAAFRYGSYGIIAQADSFYQQA